MLFYCFAQREPMRVLPQRVGYVQIVCPRQPVLCPSWMDKCKEASFCVLFRLYTLRGGDFAAVDTAEVGGRHGGGQPSVQETHVTFFFGVVLHEPILKQQVVGVFRQGDLPFGV